MPARQRLGGRVSDRIAQYNSKASGATSFDDRQHGLAQFPSGVDVDPVPVPLSEAESDSEKTKSAEAVTTEAAEVPGEVGDVEHSKLSANSITDNPIALVEEVDAPPTSPTASKISFSSDTSTTEKSRKPRKSKSHKPSARREARLKEALAAREAAKPTESAAEVNPDDMVTVIEGSETAANEKDEQPRHPPTTSPAEPGDTEETSTATMVEALPREEVDKEENPKEKESVKIEELPADTKKDEEDTFSNDEMTLHEQSDKEMPEHPVSTEEKIIDDAMPDDSNAEPLSSKEQSVDGKIDRTPAETSPIAEAWSIEEASADNEAAEEVDVEEAPIEEAPIEEGPIEEAPSEEAPIEEAPIEETSIEEAPIEEAPAEEAPVEEAPAEVDTSIEEVLAPDASPDAEVAPAEAGPAATVEPAPISPTSPRSAKPNGWTRPARQSSGKSDAQKKDKSRRNRNHVPRADKLVMLTAEVGPQEALKEVTKQGFVRHSGTADIDSDEETELVYVRVPRSQGTQQIRDSGAADGSRQHGSLDSGLEVHRRHKHRHHRHHSLKDGGELSKQSSPEEYGAGRVSSHQRTGSRPHHHPRHGSTNHDQATVSEEGRSLRHGSRRGSRDDGGQIPLAKKIVTGLVKGVEKAFMPAEIKAYSKPPPTSASRPPMSDSRMSKK